MGDPESVALVEWVNTFGSLSKRVTALEDLSDGIVLADILHDIAPAHFDRDAVARNNTSNWAIGLTNLKKLIKNLQSYYEDELGLQSDFNSLDLGSISREKNVGEIVKVIELVVVAAVRSPDRNRDYVNKIMDLSSDSQEILKATIESAMHRTSPVGQALPSPQAPPHYMVEELETSLTAEREEKERIVKEHNALKSKLTTTTDELNDLKYTVNRQNEHLEAQRKRTEAAQRQADELRTTNDRLSLKLEEKELDLEHLRQEVESLTEKARSEKEKYERTEESSRRMADELDVMRVKATELSKLEATVEKYKQKLDQASSARQHIKDLGDQNSKYLDQIMALEDEVKTIPPLKKAMDQYKDKVMELEREKYKALEGLQLKDAEIGKLREEVEAAQDAKRFLTDEVNALKKSHGESQEANVDGGNGGLGLFEDAVDVREKIARLERENRALKKEIEEGGFFGAAGEEALSLRSQLQVAEKLKEEREQEAIKSKRRCVELDADLKTLRVHVEELEDEISRLKSENGVTSSKQAAAAEAIIEKLKARVKDDEATITTLKNEKDRLEQYTRKTLQTVQEKYVQTLESLKNHNSELKERNKFLEDRSSKDKALHKREERLLMSAMYELGMDMIGPRIGAETGGKVVAPPGFGFDTTKELTSSQLGSTMR